MKAILWVKLVLGAVMPWIAAKFQKSPAPPGMKWELVPMDFQVDYFAGGTPGTELRKARKRPSKT